MNVLGLIPARGGSKGIPGKNITPLAGKPLLAYTCEAALGSRCLSRVLLNTDDPQIAEIGKQFGVEVPFLRTAHLAQDDTPILPVIQQTLEWLAEQDSYIPQAIMLLQPTSPLRRSAHIDAAIDIFNRKNADTVVSVLEVPHQFNPVSVMNLTKDGCLVPYYKGPMILRRQDKPAVFARNGPAVLVTRREVIKRGQLYGERVFPYLMGRIESLDIDEEIDIQIADYWLQKRL